MTAPIALLLLAALTGLGLPAPAAAQAVGDVFRQVSPSVVVIRSRGRDVSATGQVRFGEIGDVLLAVDGIPAGNLADYMRMREHLQRLAPGATITVTVLRAGRVVELVGRAP